MKASWNQKNSFDIGCKSCRQISWCTHYYPVLSSNHYYDMFAVGQRTLPLFFSSLSDARVYHHALASALISYFHVVLRLPWTVQFLVAISYFGCPSLTTSRHDMTCLITFIVSIGDYHIFHLCLFYNSWCSPHVCPCCTQHSFSPSFVASF